MTGILTFMVMVYIPLIIHHTWYTSIPSIDYYPTIIPFLIMTNGTSDIDDVYPIPYYYPIVIPSMFPMAVIIQVYQT
jgi:hypothetical protein